MMTTWGASLSPIFWLAVDSTKIITGLVLGVLMLAVVALMLRSIGIDQHTPPAMVFRKIKLFFGALILPFMASRKLKEADTFEESGKLSEALDIYLRLFDFDGMLSTSARLAIHNETLLERIEDICERTGYTFPAEQINRFREDIYDYYLVRQKHLTPADYDGTPLHRPENEDRFKEKLNMSQESDLIKGFQHFLSTMIQRLQEHLKGGGVVARPRVKKEQASLSQVGLDVPDVPFGAEHQADENEELYTNDPSSDLPSQSLGQPPAPAQKDANPFSMDDPRSPFSESTGTIRKLTGVEEDQPISPTQQPSGGFPSSNPFGKPETNAPFAPAAGPFGQSRSQDALASIPNGAPAVAEPPKAAPIAIPQPGFPAAAPPPQPTGGFPGFGQAPPSPSGAFGAAPGGFPGAQAPAPRPAAQGFPQPTGGFPGFQGPPQGAPQGMPQPTGGFPGFQGPPQGAPRPAAPGFPQPTGGFPGFQGPPQGVPAPRPAAPGFPQPTGGFPGFQGPPQGAPTPQGFPQPTGGFPGVQGAPAPRPAAPGFPQPTGGFPGFQGPPQGAPAPQGFPQPTGGFPGFQGPPPGFPGQNKK